MAPAQPTDILLSIAEQLKVPLGIIARQAELSQLTGDTPGSMADIGVQAGAALSLIDSYLLGLELSRGQAQLELEPVSVSSALADTAHELYRYAKANNVLVEVCVEGRYEPVMANGRGLRAALLSLGYELIEAQPALGNRRNQLVLAAHRTPHGIAAGMYGQYEELNAQSWRRSLKLCGQARQPYAALSSGGSAGLFVADTILQAMSARLRVGRHHKQSGLGATLQPSRQLSFV